MSEQQQWEQIARALIAKTEQMVEWYKIDPTMPLVEAGAFAAGYVLGRLTRFEAYLIELRELRPDLREQINKILEVAE